MWMHTLILAQDTMQSAELAHDGNGGWHTTVKLNTESGPDLTNDERLYMDAA